MENIVLKNDRLTVEISPRGAELQSIRDENGVQRLYQGDTPFWGSRAPVLFPVAGGFKDDRYEMDGKTYRVLVEGKSKNKENYLSGRTDGNIIIEFPGDESLIGDFCRVKVTESLNWILRGELAQ